MARELDLTDSAVRAWVAQAHADRTKGKTGLTTADREELARLRKRAQRDRHLGVLVRESFEGSRQRYGSPRVWEDLREQEIRVSRKRVVRLMQKQRLRARARNRFKSTTMSDHDQPVTANLLNREFTAAAPNQRKTHAPIRGGEEHAETDAHFSACEST